MQPNKLLKRAIKARASVLLAGLTGILLVIADTSRAQPIVAADQRPVPGFDRGELLLGELNCVACHPGTTEFANRLAARQPPVLAAAGARLTPQFLKSFLASPHAEKPGTTMPDVLAGLPPAKRAEVVDGLVQYLASVGQSEPEPAVAAEPVKVERGKRLYHSVGCVACHEPFEAGGGGAIPTTLKPTSVPLGDLARKTTVGELAKFLLDPLAVRPSGRMPSLGLSAAEATAIAIYLLRDQAPGLADASKLDRLDGLRYYAFEGGHAGAPPAGDAGLVADFAESYPGNLPSDARPGIRVTAAGVADKFDVGLRTRDDQFALMFEGFISAPADGEYTFWTASDDGSRLYINDRLIVRNDGDHGNVEETGKVTLTKGEHALRVTFYDNGGGEELFVRWQGPGFRKQQIPGGVLSHLGQAMQPTGAIDFAVEATKAAAGRTHFQQYGCANCHGMPDAGPALMAAFRLKNFDELKSADAGCLADQPTADAANYQLSANQRTALRATLANRAALNQPLSPAQQIQHTLARLNCYACHERDGVGGPGEERRDYFAMNGEADLGDEGRMPPHLTGVGAKLNADWMRELLTQGTKVRPYMATRMPVFGEPNVAHLVDAFAKTDGGDQPDRPVLASLEDAKFGRKLVGSTGLSCIACHNFGEYKSLGIPAMNLTEMSRRLRQDWFHRYVVDPASLRPGTRMPSFWPEGRAVNTEILGGDTGRQIDAIWAFLSRNPETSPPDGLVQGQWEIVADKAPVIYRHFIEGAGTRAIGVGYPEKVNLAWDANQLRLALIWQGPFIDAARHRAGRGEGFQGPLGYNVFKFAEGPPLAVLAEASAPWPPESGNPAGFRMRGYQFDGRMQPMFHYEFNGVQVTDYPVVVPGAIDASFRRTLKFTGANPPANLWFRAATGGDIIKTTDGAWTVDGRLRIKFPGAAAGVVARKNAGVAELLVPVKFTNGKAEIAQELVW